MVLSPLNLFLSRIKVHLFWILRRASAGFSAGFVAWFFIPIVSRLLSEGSSPMVIFAICGFMGGAFLGCVDGMVEESTAKTVRGAAWGGAGGILGGIIFTLMRGWIPEEQILWAMFVYWAFAGAFIGMVSAFWEKQRSKLLAGIAFGFVGGGAGGFFGSWLHANLIQQVSFESWFMQRLSESLMGGFIGLTLWFFLGIAERFFIFTRRPIKNRDHKNCDRCQEKNPLTSWYCGSCGAVLQESAPPEKLNLPPYKTLFRLQQMCRFLSRLSAATGVIAGFVACFMLIDPTPFFLIAILVFIALIAYTLQTAFSALSESLKILIK